MRIAIVDDDKEYHIQERQFIEAYSAESGEKFDIDDFYSGMDFITDYKPVYDIIFLDIEMPLMDGMTMAKKIRQVDERVCLVFITKMAKYAIEGYEVNAVDFVVKPIKSYNFTDKLKKAIAAVKAHSEKELLVKSDGNYYRIRASDIYYVVKEKNFLVYSTSNGEIREYGTIENVKGELAGSGFIMCNSGCLVNVWRITKVTQNSVIINGEELPLSRRRIKDFKQEMLSILRGKA